MTRPLTSHAILAICSIVAVSGCENKRIDVCQNYDFFDQITVGVSEIRSTAECLKGRDIQVFGYLRLTESYADSAILYESRDTAGYHDYSSGVTVLLSTEQRAHFDEAIEIDEISYVRFKAKYVSGHNIEYVDKLEIVQSR